MYKEVRSIVKWRVTINGDNKKVFQSSSFYIIRQLWVWRISQICPVIQFANVLLQEDIAYTLIRYTAYIASSLHALVTDRMWDRMTALMLPAIKFRKRMNEPLLACNFTVSTIFEIWMLIATLLEATLLHQCQQVSAEIKDWEIPIDYDITVLQNNFTSQFLGYWRVSGSSLITES